MSDQDQDRPQLIDPLDILTVAELRVGGKIAGTDLVHAIVTPTHHRADALAITCWLLAKRSDPAASVDTYRRMTLTEVSRAASLLAGNSPELLDELTRQDDAGDGDDQADEQPAEPAAEPAKPGSDADPTAPSSSSRSRGRSARQ